MTPRRRIRQRPFPMEFRELHTFAPRNRELNDSSTVEMGRMSDGTAGVIFKAGNFILPMTPNEAVTLAANIVETIEAIRDN